jgi:hypothetical protein
LAISLLRRFSARLASERISSSQWTSNILRRRTCPRQKGSVRKRQKKRMYQYREKNYLFSAKGIFFTLLIPKQIYDNFLRLDWKVITISIRKFCKFQVAL